MNICKMFPAPSVCQTSHLLLMTLIKAFTEQHLFIHKLTNKQMVGSALAKQWLYSFSVAWHNWNVSINKSVHRIFRCQPIKSHRDENSLSTLFTNCALHSQCQNYYSNNHQHFKILSALMFAKRTCKFRIFLILMNHAKRLRLKHINQHLT